jgi:hypothetical protein
VPGTGGAVVDVDVVGTAVVDAVDVEVVDDVVVVVADSSLPQATSRSATTAACAAG